MCARFWPGYTHYRASVCEVLVSLMISMIFLTVLVGCDTRRRCAGRPRISAPTFLRSEASDGLGSGAKLSRARLLPTSEEAMRSRETADLSTDGSRLSCKNPGGGTEYLSRAPI